MTQPVLIVPGIKHNPDDMFTWVDRASRYFELDHKIMCEKLEYKVGPLRTKNILKKLARELADVILQYNERGFIPNIQTHSNGAVVFCIALWLEPALRVSSWHAIAPACYSSCKENGLNRAVDTEQVKKVYNYHSVKDKVVRKARFFKFLSYGDAGFGGFTEATNPESIINVNMTPWRHSDFTAQRRLPLFLARQVLPNLI